MSVSSPRPLYHFNIPDLQVHDPHGLELPNAEAARRHAERLAEGIATVARSLNAGTETFVEAVDETGTTVARLMVNLNDLHGPNR